MRDDGIVQYRPSCDGVFKLNTRSCGMSPQLLVR